MNGNRHIIKKMSPSGKNVEKYYEIYPADRLEGVVRVQGSKNGALPMMAAAILTEEQVCLSHCPRISDVFNTIEILQKMGVRSTWRGEGLVLDASGFSADFPGEIPADCMRSSVLLLGAMLARAGKARIPYPGGCKIGKRPVDIHVNILRQLGCKVEEREKEIRAEAGENFGKEGIRNIDLPFPSVGATENAMLVSVVSKGTTIIHGAAREPEIAALGEMLNLMGGRIFGAGTSCVSVEGVKKLRGCRMKVPGDRIVAGTYLTAAAATGGEIVLSGVPSKQLESVLVLLSRMGCTISVWQEKDQPCIALKRKGELSFRGKIKTRVYPGFPTDMQSQFGVLLAGIPGEHLIQETIFESRFLSLLELRKMGADIRQEVQDPSVLRIYGGKPLRGCPVQGTDLRGTAALAIAALTARGVTSLSGIPYLLRGYEDLIGDLSCLGARIEERGTESRKEPEL